MPEELLYHSGILPVLEEVCGERVSERMARGTLRDPGLPDGRSNGPLRYRGIAVVPPLLARVTIDPARPLREDPLPLPLGWGGGVLPSKRVGELDVPESIGEVLSMNFPRPFQFLSKRFCELGR